MKLTQTVKKSGCAAKVAAFELKDILAKLDFPIPNPKLKVDSSSLDDAAIYELNETQSFVATLDFFTPIVNDPKLFGQIAAANALSDIYAMGGKPLLALSILAFPLMILDNSIIAEILQGAIDVLKKAGAHLAGGHTIDDESLKFGLSVTGLVDNDKLLTNSKAKPGDKLILTKALGTGTLVAALKQGIKGEEELTEVFDSMSTLNDFHTCLSEKDISLIHAMTDVTGFGLAGHAYQMAQASQVSIAIESSSLPVFTHARETIKKECLTKAHTTNKAYVSHALSIDKDVAKTEELIFFDPQTSGGLLISVEKDHAHHIAEKLKKDFPNTTIIGDILEKKKKDLYLAP